METAALIGLQLLLSIMLRRILKSSELSPILTVALSFYVVLWLVVPVIIRLAFWESVVHIVTYEQFVAAATIESSACLVVLFLTNRLRMTPRSAGRANRLTMHPWSGGRVSPVALSKRSIIVLSLIGCCVTIVVGLQSADASYLEQNSRNTSSASGAGDLANSMAMLEQIMLAYMYVLLFRGTIIKNSGKLGFACCTAWIGVYLGFQIRSGGRFGLLLPLFLTIAYGHSQRWSARRWLGSAGAIASATAVLAWALLGVISDVRSHGSAVTAQTVGDAVLSVARGDQGQGSDMNHFLNEVVGKLDSITFGAKLLDMSGGQSVGAAPYLGAVVGIFPRALFPGKPVPGTLDGSYLTHPSRLVAQACNMDMYAGNVNVSPAAVARWHFGALGIVLFILASLCYLYVLNTLMLSKVTLGAAVALASLSVPTCVGVVSSPDVLIMNLERLLFVATLVWMWRYRGSRVGRARSKVAAKELRLTRDPTTCRANQ